MSDLEEEFSAELVEAAKFKVRVAYMIGAAAAYKKDSTLGAFLCALIDTYPEVLDPPGMATFRVIAEQMRPFIPPIAIQSAVALLKTEHPWKP